MIICGMSIISRRLLCEVGWWFGGGCFGRAVFGKEAIDALLVSVLVVIPLLSMARRKRFVLYLGIHLGTSSPIHSLNIVLIKLTESPSTCS